MINVNGLGTTASAWPSANQMRCCSFIVDDTVTVTQLGTIVSTQSGNLDLGIYDEAGNKIVSSGSTAVGVAGPQFVNITDTTLTPGHYNMAMACDNIIANFNRLSLANADVNRLCGVKQMASAFPLPSTLTFAGPGNGIFHIVMGFAGTVA